VSDAPYYLPLANAVEIFQAAYAQRLPLLLKGPTGCGKTRFVEYMSWVIGQQRNADKTAAAQDLITVACQEDLTAADLVGRYLLIDGETRWSDGPLTRAARNGSICYLDEIVEARKDTTVIIHALTDHRRLLPIDRTGELLEAHPNFLLVISYNPGYQSALKDLKPSTRQRFVSIEFDYPSREREAEIIIAESGASADLADRLSIIGEKIRNLKEHGFEEGVSTRLLVYCASLTAQGLDARTAAEHAITQAITDDRVVHQSVSDIIDAILPAAS
jgi:nitric oxide reductase NorQ protein